MTPIRARKKPVDVTALQWDGTNTEQVKTFVGERQQYGTDKPEPVGTGECGFLLGREVTAFRSAVTEAIVYDRFHDWVPLGVGDWIVCGLKGEFYPVQQDVFPLSYDIVDLDAGASRSASERK